MKSFAYRLVSMGARFCCPLIILAISTPATMGEYYLFTTYFTFIVFLIALELGVPFSRKYLRSSGPGKRRVFASFVITQLALSFTLAAPATAVYFIGASGMPLVVVLFFFAVVTESCVNEVGRFFWNIGQTKVASRRDLFRSLIFVFAVLAAVVVNDEIVSGVSLGLIICSNALILVYEMRVWGDRGLVATTLLYVNRRRARLMYWRVLRSVDDSLPQVVHIQILSLVPLLERSLIGSKIGLEAVAAYSFQYSVIQTGASLFLLPVVAQVRRTILSAKSSTDISSAQKESLGLLLNILAVATVLALIAHFAVPYITEILKKGIASSAIVLAAALLSSSVATFSSAISPLYGHKGRLVRANVITVLCITPLAMSFLYRLDGVCGNALQVMMVIALAATAQMVVRVFYLLRQRM